MTVKATAEAVARAATTVAAVVAPAAGVVRAAGSRPSRRTAFGRAAMGHVAVGHVAVGRAVVGRALRWDARPPNAAPPWDRRRTRSRVPRRLRPLGDRCTRASGGSALSVRSRGPGSHVTVNVEYTCAQWSRPCRCTHRYRIPTQHSIRWSGHASHGRRRLRAPRAYRVWCDRGRSDSVRLTSRHGSHTAAPLQAVCRVVYLTGRAAGSAPMRVRTLCAQLCLNADRLVIDRAGVWLRTHRATA